jgi:hypothetical protein
MLHEAEGIMPHGKPRKAARRSDIRKQLKEHMQTEFRNLYKHEKRARTNDVVAIIKSDYPELIREISDELTTRALQSMAAEVAGTWSAVADKGDRQLVLPGMETELLERLPPALSIPVDGSVHEIDFVPAHLATLAEWKSHCDYLLSKYEGLGIVLAAIQELIERGTETGCPDGTSLLLWLSKHASTAKG